MSDETNKNESRRGNELVRENEPRLGQSSQSGQALEPVAPTPPGAPVPLRRDLLPLPGLAAIAFYMFILAGVIVFGVVSGRHYPPLFLIFSALFFTASGGLLMLFRWAWAMTLAAVLLLAGYNMWIAFSLHQPPSIVQSLLNFVFFLYLVRPEVREKLR
ncbi:MAG: hypothetical protein WA795_01235 [Candidatus Sulfotelmatobacter sp.]